MKLINLLFILFIVLIPFSMNASVDFQITPSCIGQSIGSIDLTIDGSGAPYDFSWSTGAITEDIENLSAGTYTVTVTYLGGIGLNDCSFEYERIITEENCCEDCYTIGADVGDGSIYVQLECMENSGFTYVWSDGGMGISRSGLAIGEYCVTATSSSGCVSFGCWDVTSECSSTTLTDVNADIISACTASPMGGSIQILDPYIGDFNTYIWTGPNNYLGFGSNISGLEAGEYCVSIYNWFEPNCATATGCFIVDSDGPQCCSDCYPIEANVGAGSIFVQLECLETTGYTYIWSDGGTGNPRTDLKSGTYCVTATSSSGCSLSGCWDMEEECPEIFNLTMENVVMGCNSNSIGLINIPDWEGASAIWTDSNGNFIGIGETINNLIEGEEYCVVIKYLFGETSNCILAEGCFVFEENTLVVGIASIVNNETFNTCEGSIDLNVTSSSPTSYNWASATNSMFSSSVQDPFDLCPGVYNVTVTNSEGCTATASVTLFSCEGSTELGISLNQITQIDVGVPTGSIDVNITSGSWSPIYFWIGPDPFTAYTQDISGLGIGTYCLTIDNGCETEKQCYEIVDCSAVNWLIDTDIEPSCPGANAGIVRIDASGGVRPFRYDWGDGIVGSIVNDQLAVGIYTVTVYDKNYCSEVVSYEIEEEDPVINVTADIGHTCTGYEYGTIRLSVTGDDSPFSYQWSANVTTTEDNDSDAIFLGVGDYSVTVIDDRGCSKIVEPYTITGSNIIMDEDQTLRDDCLFEKFCNGESVFALAVDLIAVQEVDPDDCRIYENRCQGDGGYYYPSGTNSNIVETETELGEPNLDNCTMEELCTDGEVYDTHIGVDFEMNFSGLNASITPGCYYCFTATYCKFTIYGEETLELKDIDNHIGVVVQNTPPVECNDQSGSCVVDIICSNTNTNVTLADDFCDPDCESTSPDYLCSLGEMETIAGSLINPSDEYYQFIQLPPSYNDFEVKRKSKELTNTNFSAKVYPNPFHTDFQIRIESEFTRQVGVRVTNVVGKLIKEVNVSVKKGSNIISIRNLIVENAGIYYLTLSDKDNNNLMTIPIVKK